LAANASLIQLTVTRTRAAIFSSRSRMVESSPSASACGRTASQHAHQPNRRRCHGQTYLVGQRRAAIVAVGGGLALVPLDQVLAWPRDFAKLRGSRVRKTKIADRNEGTIALCGAACLLFQHVY
jgi:hypothetical protein